MLNSIEPVALRAWLTLDAFPWSTANTARPREHGDGTCRTQNPKRTGESDKD